MTVVHALRQSLGLLPKSDRLKLSIIACLQAFLNVLDLIGIALVGLIGALAYAIITSSPTPEIVTTLELQLPGGPISPETLLILMAATTVCLLLTKSLVASYLMRKSLAFLSTRQSAVSTILSRRLFSMPLTWIQSRSSQEIGFALIQGAGYATTILIGQAMVAASEFALLLLLGAALLLAAPELSLVAMCLLLGLAFALNRVLGRWATDSGRTASQADIEGLNLIQESIRSYREIHISANQRHFLERFAATRDRAAIAGARFMYAGLLPKYVLEVALLGGAFTMAAVAFATQTPENAAGILSVFLAAGLRALPAVLRLQVAILSMKNATSIAQGTYELAVDLQTKERESGIPDAPTLEGEDICLARSSHAVCDSETLSAPISIEVDGIQFSYPASESVAIEGVTFSVRPGSITAIIGPSGSGKSTLADLLLGVLLPDYGTVSLSGFEPRAAIQRWPSGISYVPQEVTTIRGTIRSNLLLGSREDVVGDESLWNALDQAHLASHVASLGAGLDALVGEGGVILSGGERQRLGLARALLRDPKLIVLDEPTSALDAETEAAVVDVLTALHGKVTLVIIAHRLSTVRAADQVIYLEEGRVRAAGTFAQLERRVPTLAGKMGQLE